MGRATKGAALALKSRVLLYAASDLYNLNPSGMPETGYTGGQDRAAHWRAAKDAAKAVMDLGTYSLFRPEPASPEEAVLQEAESVLEEADPAGADHADGQGTRKDQGYGRSGGARGHGCSAGDGRARQSAHWQAIQSSIIGVPVGRSMRRCYSGATSVCENLHWHRAPTM